MAAYTIRVELHNATWQNYVDLADDLARFGIVDVIVSDDGKRYRMPPAEYTYAGAATQGQIYERAKASAAGVVQKYAVLVTESNGRRWCGLEAA